MCHTVSPMQCVALCVIPPIAHAVLRCLSPALCVTPPCHRLSRRTVCPAVLWVLACHSGLEGMGTGLLGLCAELDEPNKIKKYNATCVGVVSCPVASLLMPAHPCGTRGLGLVRSMRYGHGVHP